MTWAVNDSIPEQTSRSDARCARIIKRVREVPGNVSWCDKGCFNGANKLKFIHNYGTIG